MSVRIFTRLFKGCGILIPNNKLQLNMYRLNDSIVANKIKVYTELFLFYYEIQFNSH